MAFYGNPVGGFCYPKTYILTDENGTEMATGVVVGEKTVFTATDNDVRQGLVYAGDEGVSTGLKDIPAYRTTQGLVVVSPNDKFSILLDEYQKYDYTKLQCVIAKFNTTASNSVAVDRVVIDDSVYAVNSINVISSVTKNAETKTINLNITNNSNDTYVLRYFTYREEE
jgi:hypothetical protein